MSPNTLPIILLSPGVCYVLDLLHLLLSCTCILDSCCSPSPSSLGFGGTSPPSHFPAHPHTGWLWSSKCSLMCFSLWHHSDPGSHHFLPWRQFNRTRSSCIHSSVCIHPHPLLSDSHGSWHWQAQLFMPTQVYSSKLKERMVFLLPWHHSKYSKHWLIQSLV